eukprot:4133365-Pyramimonas_sp.AAC.1
MNPPSTGMNAPSQGTNAPSDCESEVCALLYGTLAGLTWCSPVPAAGAARVDPGLTGQPSQPGGRPGPAPGWQSRRPSLRAAGAPRGT